MEYRKLIKNKIKKILDTGYMQIFAINFVIAAISFIGIILKGEGIFTLCNDFNEQQIPFHMLANNSLKNGEFLWNWSIDLGSSFVGALGFYVLGSPFAWWSFLFPAKIYPYLVGWLYMTKYATAGMLSYGYIKRFAGKKYAALGSVLYAFSGFQAVNLIFHHFHDAVAFFPLLLIGYEKLAREGKKGALALGVCINAFVNYYFFIQEVIFLIIYFLCREGFRLWKKRILIGRCFIEGIMGIGMAGILFIPSILFTLQNPRITNFLPMNYWIYKGNRDYLQIIRTLLFPGELMCSQSCIKEYDWSSWSAYLPMIGITMVICYVIYNKKNWLSNIMCICILATGIPLINSIFGLFSDTNYHRWLYMLILLMSLASALVMEQRERYPIKRVSLGLTIFMVCMVIGSYWWSSNKFVLINQPLVFLIWSVIGIAGVFFTCLITFFIRKESIFFVCMGCGIITFSIITTGMTAELYHRFSGQDSRNYYDRLMAFQEFTLPDERYRIASNDNTLLMAASLPGTGSFTSMVNGSIYEFYESLGTSRPVFTPEGPDGTLELVGGKYYVSDQRVEGQKYLQKVSRGKYTFYLYENELALPIGTSYDMYLTKSQFMQIPQEIRGIAMLKCIVVPDNKEYLVRNTMKEYNWEEGGLSVEDKEVLINERCKESSHKLEKIFNTFFCTIDVSADKFAFFSIPFDHGFTAYVNGTEVEIINTNGMMAIPLKKGQNTIKFIYRNYSLIIGIVCSAVSFCFWSIYRKKDYIISEREMLIL